MVSSITWKIFKIAKSSHADAKWLVGTDIGLFYRCRFSANGRYSAQYQCGDLRLILSTRSRSISYRHLLTRL